MVGSKSSYRNLSLSSSFNLRQIQSKEESYAS